MSEVELLELIFSDCDSRQVWELVYQWGRMR